MTANMWSRTRAPTAIVRSARLFTVGGASSLRTPDGDALDFLKGGHDVEWVNLSPTAGIAPGERTGTYRVAEEDLVMNESGESFITAEDDAVTVIDEIENKRFSKKRFAVGGNQVDNPSSKGATGTSSTLRPCCA